MEEATLSIGAVARRSGLNPSAIRYYEQAGLLPRPGRTGGRRMYSDAIFDRLALLEFAKRSGFTLEEIRRLFAATREGVPVSARWRQLAATKIRALDQQVREIEVMRVLLRRALACRCLDVDECGRKIRRAQQSREL